jgi:hypothetical protein
MNPQAARINFEWMHKKFYTDICIKMTQVNKLITAVKEQPFLQIQLFLILIEFRHTAAA